MSDTILGKAWRPVNEDRFLAACQLPELELVRLAMATGDPDYRRAAAMSPWDRFFEVTGMMPIECLDDYGPGYCNVTEDGPPRSDVVRWLRRQARRRTLRGLV